MLNDAPISWKSKQQSIISHFTHDAEYIDLANATYEANWLRRLIQAALTDHPSVSSAHLLGDNRRAIYTAYAPRMLLQVQEQSTSILRSISYGEPLSMDAVLGEECAD